MFQWKRLWTLGTVKMRELKIRALNAMDLLLVSDFCPVFMSYNIKSKEIRDSW